MTTSERTQPVSKTKQRHVKTKKAKDKVRGKYQDVLKHENSSSTDSGLFPFSATSEEEDLFGDQGPSKNVTGQINPADGYEWLEHPKGSGVHYVRARKSDDWSKWQS